MNNATVNFTSDASTNSKCDAFVEITSLDLCMCSISMLFGLPTHSYIIWLIVRGIGNGVTSDLFNLSLSFCEIGICLNMLFPLIYYCTGLSHFLSLGWFSLGLLITGRPLFQCLMCVERYLAVVHPVIFLKYKPFRYRVICCTAAWIITLGSCLCCIFIGQFKYVYIYFYSIQFLLFLSIQLLSCGCSQSSEAVSTRRERKTERGRKPHEEKSILHYSNNYCDDVYYIYPIYCLRVLFYSYAKVYCGFSFFWFVLFYCGWFCSACSLSETGWKTLLLLFSIKHY